MEGRQNTIIPNVSTIFRQLVQLTHIDARLNSNTNNNFNQLYSRSNNINYNNNYKNQQRIDFVSDMGLDDRQKRHQQLMNRFKSSLQQNRQIFGMNQNTKSNLNYNAYSNKNYLNQNRSNPTNQYIYSFQTTSNNYNNNQNSSKWFAPKIKYRHIQDFQKKNQQKKYNQNQIVNQQPNGLKKEFYGTGFSRKSYKQAQNINNISQQEYNNIEKNHEKQINKTFNKISKLNEEPSKYNNKLESYYELCRKPIKKVQTQQKESNQMKKTQEKFIRRPSQKVECYNIEKALKILSMD